MSCVECPTRQVLGARVSSATESQINHIMKSFAVIIIFVSIVFIFHFDFNWGSSDKLSDSRSAASSKDHARRSLLEHARELHLDSEVARLRADVDTLSRDLGNVSGAVQAEEEEEEEPARIPEIDTDEDTSEESINEFYYKQFYNQPRDPSWSQRQESNITTLIDEMFESSSLSSIECRTSSCRLEIRHESRSARDEMVNLWLSSLFRHGGFSEYDELANTTTLLVAREGFEFKDPLTPRE